VLTRLRAAAPASAYQWVVEATGRVEGFAEAVRMAQPRGTVILKSTLHDKVPVDTAPVVVNEITLVGSRCGRFEPALKLLRQGRVKPETMISARLPLRDAPRAFRLASRRESLKILLEAG